MKNVTAIVLAGIRPGGDPFAEAMRVPYKALIPVAGEAMLLRVIRTLRASAPIGRIVVIGLPTDALDVDVDLRALHDAGEFQIIEGAATPSRSVLAAVDSPGFGFPFLVTTADHPLLTTEIVERFWNDSLGGNRDVTVGITAAGPVSEMFPGVRRTNHHFRDGSYCGCNLFGLMTPAARRGPEEWVRVEQFRKQPWRIVSILGPITLLRFLLGRLTLADALALASQRFGIAAGAVMLPQPEAGFDVDSPVQLQAVEEYFAGRSANQRVKVERPSAAS